MRRPPGLWILLSIGILWLSLQDVCGIRATALIFAKSTTTTTTEGTVEAANEGDGVANSTDPSPANTTKYNLTGNPQVDYLYDPNLPQELNGYNLSAYPFYERVPDEKFDFKCDGLHDGFYASIPHKCQVYHHCLYGTRYDFLCANYTAFDQKTFICQFVSDVDCVGSKKYWHRNDALYQAASTTTVKPQIIYTPPAPPAILTGGGGANARRPATSRRRPLRRRRPQYDYYEDEEEYDDEYYEERPRRKRPRPRPRPAYEEDDDYEDERYERRGSGRRDEDRNRKTYDRRPERRRNKDRRTYEDDDKVEEDGEDKRRTHEEDSVEENKRRNKDREDLGDKRSGERRTNKRKPVDDYEDDEDRRRTRPKSNRRPIEDDYEDEKSEAVADKPIIKPSSGSSIYDRPRTAPRIKPPVPKTETTKYAYKPIATKAPPLEDDYEYEDDPPRPTKPTRKPETESRRYSTRRDEDRKAQSSRLRPQSTEVVEQTSRRTKYHHRSRASSTKKPVEEEYYEDYEEEPVSKERTRSVPSKQEKRGKPSTTTTTTTGPTTSKDFPKPENVVRIVKRPFLPSRGGSPYSARGLQPVGAKATDKQEFFEEDEEDEEVKPVFKPSPVVVKVPNRAKVENEEFKPVSNRPQTVSRLQSFKSKEGPRTTQKPKVEEVDPLNLDDEYDVTLNDALNPTLPNLPVRGFPTGFSSGNDYVYNAFQRPRYVADTAAGSTDYVYQSKPARQRYEEVPAQEQFVNRNNDYKGQYSTIQSYRPTRVTQAYYTTY